MVDLKIKRRNFYLIKKIMKRFKEQCDSSKSSDNQHVHIIRASDTDWIYGITYRI